MTPAARLQATLDLLIEIDTTPRPADALTSAYFRARRYIGSKDRAAISFMLYDVLRHTARLSWWIGAEADQTPRHKLLAWLVLVDQKKSETIADMFDGSKFAPQPLTEGERSFLKKWHTRTIDHPDMSEDVRGECPAWAAPRLKARFGEKFLNEMQALLDPAPLDLRVNTLKTDRAMMLAALIKLGFKAKPCTHSSLGIRIDERPNLANLPMLKDGSVEIQDEGSQLAAALVDAKPGMRVIDFCAGAGGKTLAIAAQMQNKGRIVACDVLAGRLKRSAERFRRAGVHNIEIHPIESERDPWVRRHKESFDRVLVDAPCSGTGTWRRNPDSRWRDLGPGIDKLLEVQRKILENASRMLKGGGKLVYATCSLLPEENEHQIEKFLEENSDFSREEPYLNLTPAQHGTDGFFAAVLQKAKKLD